MRTCISELNVLKEAEINSQEVPFNVVQDKLFLCFVSQFGMSTFKVGVKWILRALSEDSACTNRFDAGVRFDKMPWNFVVFAHSNY